MAYYELRISQIKTLSKITSHIIIAFGEKTVLNVHFTTVVIEFLYQFWSNKFARRFRFAFEKNQIIFEKGVAHYWVVKSWTNTNNGAEN